MEYGWTDEYPFAFGDVFVYFFYPALDFLLPLFNVLLSHHLSVGPGRVRLSSPHIEHDYFTPYIL